jgi:hypothetical protein
MCVQPGICLRGDFDMHDHGFIVAVWNVKPFQNRSLHRLCHGTLLSFVRTAEFRNLSETTIGLTDTPMTGLPRTRGKRQYDRAAEQRDELAPDAFASARTSCLQCPKSNIPRPSGK